MSERKRSAKGGRTSGEMAALDEAQARGGPDRAVDGIDERTSRVNPDSAVDTRPHPDLDGLGGSEQGGLAGAVGYFEGEGNEVRAADLGLLLLEQAQILEGATLDDPAAYVRRINSLLVNAD